MMADNVTLRAMEPEDLDFLYNIENNIALWDVGTANVPFSRYLLHDYLANASGDIYTDKQVRLIIEQREAEAGQAGAERSEARTVGLADLTAFDPRNLRAEVGIVVRQDYRGKGVGHQALAQLTDYARRVLHLHQLYAYVDAANEVSLQLFRGAGFRDAARLNDWVQTADGWGDVVLMQYFF
jgi:diamine N-acetyltransferase